jgi:hypothetical protein
MATGINHIDRVITTIAILVQAVDGVGVEVGGIIGADKAAPLGRIVPGIAVVQAGIFVVVVAAIADRVGFCDRRIAGNGAVTLQLYSTIICSNRQEKASRNIYPGGKVCGEYNYQKKQLNL